MRVVQRICRAHAVLPPLVRVQWLALLTITLAALGGGLLTLPPGPLCDGNGMVLFMEGGCDWARTNIYFFAKASTLVALNAAFVLAWVAGVRRIAGFAPHLVAAAILAAATARSQCEGYYDLPNGSIGQMVIEVAAWAGLGVVLLWRWRRRGPGGLLLALVGWNVAHVATFYLWLGVYPHWSWRHTAWVALTLIVAAVVLRCAPRRLRAATG